jgi:hypothetical protein
VECRLTTPSTLSRATHVGVCLARLPANQVPDSDGNVIPPEIMTGSYELRDLDHPAVGLLYEGKLTIDKTYGHASYGCGTCCGYYNTRLTPNPFNGPPSIDNWDSYLAQEQCGGYWDDFTNSAYFWQSSNPAVATLPNSRLHTVAVGTATGSAQNLLQATHPAPRCPQAVMGGSQPVTVKVVYQVEPLCINGNCTIDQGQDGTGGLDSCANLTGFGRGWIRYVNDQLQYQDGSAVNVPGIAVGDTISVATPNGLGISGTETGQAVTTGNGAWQDKYYVCSTACFSSTATAGATQSWTWNGRGVPHANGIVYSCSSITIDSR